MILAVPGAGRRDTGSCAGRGWARAVPVRALAGGRIAGAALDVSDDRPLPHDSTLRALGTVILAPPAAGITEDGGGKDPVHSVGRAAPELLPPAGRGALPGALCGLTRSGNRPHRMPFRVADTAGARLRLMCSGTPRREGSAMHKQSSPGASALAAVIALAPGFAQVAAIRQGEG